MSEEKKSNEAIELSLDEKYHRILDALQPGHKSLHLGIFLKVNSRSKEGFDTLGFPVKLRMENWQPNFLPHCTNLQDDET